MKKMKIVKLLKGKQVQIRKIGFDTRVVLNRQDFNKQPGFKSAEGSVTSNQIHF